ncbi:MAG: hypothetical protein MUO90_00660 [Dehalococcoidales bacterium]|nr:hypothetical protein [Dehalococcoidales bacterium]
MAKKLGKVKKPSVKKFEKGRKLFLMTLIFSLEEPEPELKELMDKYWQQVREQLGNLEGKLSQVNKVYHELISDTGEDGVKTMDEMDTGSKQIVMGCLERNAEFHPVEDRDMLREFIDWNQCISVGLLSKKVFDHVNKFYEEIQKKRQEHIARIIDETLKSDEIGLLVMREGCDVQFPPDIQVFYIAPPALDEVKQWFMKNRYSYGE